MRVTNVRISFVIVSLLVLSAALSGLGSHGGLGTLAALAASPQQKAEARNYLNQVTGSLRSVDTAYASGNIGDFLTGSSGGCCTPTTLHERAPSAVVLRSFALCCRRTPNRTRR